MPSYLVPSRVCQLGGIHTLENYRREWNERYGCWVSHPLHHFASHGADAFRIIAIGINQLKNTGLTAQEWKELRSRYMA